MFDRLQFSFARQKQFIADASHELKSPIAMLRFFFDEAIQRRDLPEAFQQQMDNQMRNVLRMDRLVKTLLELSVLEVKTSLMPVPFSLSDLLRSVVADFMPLLEKEKIHIEANLPQALNMTGDMDYIRRVLINILDNAVKYNMENGQIMLTAAENKNNICISLYNTGPGIPEDELENVFDQFYRVEKSHSPQYGGAGLGLAIVRRIVQLHGGRVKMESLEGAWARITICLPIDATI
jgi:signal transduction histidine kinase